MSRARMAKRVAIAAMMAVTAGVGVVPATPVMAVDTPLVFGATEYSFGARVVGTTATIAISLQNTGGSPIGPFTITGGEPPSAAFALAGTTCNGAPLPAFTTCTVSFSFTPGAAGGFTDTATFSAAGEDFTLVLAGIGRAVTGAIAGTVTLVNAQPATEYAVNVTSLDGSDKYQFQSLTAASYSVAVPPGSYCVSFGVSPWENTVSSYPNKRHCLDGITPVTVTSGATVSGIDATMTLASISGTVRSHTGAFATSLSVSALASGGTAEGFDSTDGVGAFTIGNLPAGTYCVSAGETSDAASATCPAGTRSVVVAAGANVIGVDIALPPPGAPVTGAIGGTVRDTGNAGLPGRSVIAESLDLAGVSQNGNTSPTGEYMLPNLPPGRYCVYVTDDGSFFAGERYADAASCDTATPVTVGTTTVTGIDFGLAAGGTITGTVTDPSGAASSAAQVEAFKIGDSRSVTALVGVGGTYSITGLSPGQYCVIADETVDNRPPRTFGGGYSCDRSVTPVTVTIGATTPNVDIQLADGGRIAGTVSFPPGFVPGEDLGFVLISTRDEDQVQSPYVGVTLAGRYTTEPLAPGRYCLTASAPTPSLLVTRDVGSTSPDSCTAGTIEVANGATTTVDFAMELGGSISGWVVSANGTPDRDPNPRLDRSVGVNDRVRPDGSYMLTGVPAGTYCVSVNTFARWEVPRTYDGVVSCEAAYTPVTVTAGQNTGNINFGMQTGGTIAGTVTRSGGVGSDRVELVRLDAAQPTIVTSTFNVTPTRSEYRAAVPPGTYCVLVRPHPSTGNANRAHGGTPSCAGATPVVVADRTAVTGVDITLTRQIYVGLANPARLLDTRPGQTTADGIAAGGGAITGGTTLELLVGGRAGVPASAASVALNVTATNTAGPGYLTVFPCGQTAPTASNVNFTAAGQTTPNAVIAKLGTGGKVCIFALTTADVIVDVAGSFPAADGFTPLANPARLLDTRAGQPVAPDGTAGTGAVIGGTVRQVQIGGLSGVPAGAASVALNVTATNTAGPGFLTVFPCGQTQPTTSNVNYGAAGQTTPNSVVSKLGTGGTVCILAFTTADVIVDVAGYFADADGLTPLPNPARVLDTRPGQPTVDGVAAGEGAIQGGTVREVPVGGRAGVPTGAASVALNVTATNTAGPGFLTVFPCGQTAPTASNVNFSAAGVTTPNAVIARLGTGGKLCVFALTTTDVIIDVAGYLPEGDGPVALVDD